MPAGDRGRLSAAKNPAPTNRQSASSVLALRSAGLIFGEPQLQNLGDKLDIHNAARVCFDAQGLAGFWAVFAFHFLANSQHGGDLGI